MTSHLITDSGIVLFHDSKHYAVSNDHRHYNQIKEALVNELYEEAILLMNARNAVKQFLTDDERFTLENDVIVLDGRAFSGAVTDKVLTMIESGNKAAPLFKFLENVRSNPSRSAQEELLLFCVANNFMITDDGCILAYKSVRGDYTDIHSGTVRNAVGDTPRMERNDVDDRRNVTCSSGFHFAAYGYASTWAGPIDGVNRKLMLMKVNPRDVVSIPNDYHNQKGRCCYYEVIDEIVSGEAIPHQEVFYLDTLNDDETIEESSPDELEVELAELEAYISNDEDRHADIERLGGEVSESDLFELEQIKDETEALRAKLRKLKTEREYNS